MAIVRKLIRITLDRDTKHSEVNDCTYSIIEGEDGRKSLQIDTYGSALRKIAGKKINPYVLVPKHSNNFGRYYHKRFEYGCPK